MPNYYTAKMTGAIDEKFQRQYNYLVDMLNEGYTVEGMTNDQKIRISVNPREGIVASKNGEVKISFDMDGNAVFTGLISADSGFIGGWTISSSGLSSGITNATAKGILSGATTAFYAGHLTPTSAPFRVTQDGVLNATGANITGVLTSVDGDLTTKLSAGRLELSYEDNLGGWIAGNSPSSGVRGLDIRSNSDILVVAEPASGVWSSTIGLYASKLFCAATFASGDYMIVEFEYGDFKFNSDGLFIENDIKTNGSYFLGDSVRILTGTGTPPALSGAKGSLYLRSDGGATTTLYVKTGTGTTDWTAK